MAKGLRIWKTIMLVSVMCLLLTLGGGLVACKPKEDNHTHNWSQSYSYDDNTHYKECTVCHQHTGTEAHSYDDEEDVTCNVCGYIRHVHTLVWKNDGQVNGKHWREYSCEHHSNEKFEEGDHVFGNDNICDICGFDKTPPHTHHEITRYDEQNHWTTYDCSEHGDVKMNVQPHTFTTSNKCDGCDFDRSKDHEHTLSGWVTDNDPRYHWKEYTCWHHANEQIDKTEHVFGDDDECDDCGYERAHDHNNFLVQRFSETEHWKTSSCHPDETGRLGVATHNFEADDLVCECGLDGHYYLAYQVYKDYIQAQEDGGSRQARATGIQEFSAWVESLKEQGVHHVDIDNNGDVVFYASAEDETGRVAYYGPRTVSFGNVSADNTWVAVKVTIGGTDTRVLAVGKKVSGEGLKLTYIPVASENAVYTAGLAKASDIPSDQIQIPVPSGAVVLSEQTTFEINPFKAKSSGVSLNVQPGLGFGLAGQFTGLSFPQYSAEIRTYYFGRTDDWQEGWYRMDFIRKSATGTWTAAGIYFTLGAQSTTSGMAQCLADGSNAYIMFRLPKEETQFTITWSGAGSVVIDVRLTQIDESSFTLKENTSTQIIATPETEDPVEYDLSRLEEGSYYIRGSVSGVSYSIGDEEATTLSSSQVIEVTAGNKNKKLKFTATKQQFFRAYFVKMDSYTTGDDYTVEAPKNGYKIEVSETNHTGVYALKWNVTEPGVYNIALSGKDSAAEFKGIKLGISKSATSNTNILNVGTSAGAKSATVHTATAGYGTGTYYIVIDTDDLNNSSYPPKLVLKITKSTSEAFTANTEITAAFGADKKEITYVGTLEAGAYVVYTKDETIPKGVSIRISGDSGSASLSSTTLISGFVITEGTSATITATYSEADNYPTVKFMVVKADGGETITDDLATTKTATLNETKPYAVYSFTETEANYHKLLLKSANNLKNVYAYCATYAPDAKAKVEQWINIGTKEEKERQYEASKSAAGTRYVIVLIAKKTVDIDYPGEVTVSFNKRLHISSTISPYNYYPAVSINSMSSTSVTGAPPGARGTTTFKLYCAALDEAGTPTEEQWGQPVKTYQYDELVRATSKTFVYYTPYSEDALTKIFGKNIYWRLVAEDSTGTYASVSKITGVKQYAATGGKTTITVNHPDDFEGDIYILLTNKNATASSSNLYGYGSAHVTSGTSSTQIVTYSPGKTSGALYAYLEVPDRDMYNMPPTTSVTAGTATGTLTFDRKAVVTATVNLPDNFRPKDGEPITISLYKGASTSAIATGTASVDVAQKKATAKIYVKYEEAEFKAAITKGLDTGYGASDTEKVAVQFAEDHKTGTVTLGINQRTKIDFNITVPARFTGGQITLKFYKYTGDAADTKSTDVKFTLEANETDSTAVQTVTTYLPKDTSYKVEFVGPTNMGYGAADIERLELNQDTITQAITVNDHIEITATVEMPKESGAASTTVYLLDKDTDKTISSATVTLEDSADKKTGTVVLYGISGIEHYMIQTTDTSAVTSTADYETATADVTMDAGNKTGHATLTCELKFTATVTYTLKGSTSFGQSTLSRSIGLYADNTKLTSLSATKGTSSDWTISVVLSHTLFDPNVNYSIGAVYFDVTVSNFIVPSVKLDWKEETAEHLELNGYVVYEKEEDYTPIDFTITVPEEYTSVADHYIQIYEVYGRWEKQANSSAWSSSTSGKSVQKVSFANVTDGKVTATYNGYPECENLTFGMYGGDLTDLKSSSLATSANTIKRFYAEFGALTYEDGRGKVAVTIKENVPLKISIPNLDNSASTPEFTLNITLKDKDNKQIGKYTYNVPADAANSTLDAYIYVLKWEEGCKAEVTISGTNPAYVMNSDNGAEIKDEGGKHVLQVNVTKKTPVKVTIPKLDNSTDTIAFAITLKVKDGAAQVVSYTINVPANADNTFVYYIYVSEWKDSYTIEATSTTSGSAYKIENGTHKLVETKPVIEINATKKEAVKVKFTGLDNTVPTSNFTLTATVKDAEGSATIGTMSIVVPADAGSDLVVYGYLDAWAAGYKVTLSGTVSQYTYDANEGAKFGADEGKIHVLNITLTQKPVVKVVIPKLEEGLTTGTFKINVTIKDSGSATVKSTSTSVSVASTDTGDAYATYMFLDKWEAGFTVEVSYSGTAPQPYKLVNAEFVQDQGKIHVLQINLEVKNSVKITIPKLDSELNTKSMSMTVKIIDTAQEDKQITSWTVSVPANSGSDFTYIGYFDNEWLESYKFTVTGSGNDIYTVTGSSFQKQTDANVWLLTVDVAENPTIKVVVNGLNVNTYDKGFTLRIEQLEPDGSHMFGSSSTNISVPIDACKARKFTGSFIAKVRSEYKFNVDIDSTTVTVGYRIKHYEVEKDTGENEHTLTITLWKVIEVNVSIDFPAEFTASADKTLIFQMYAGDKNVMNSYNNKNVKISLSKGQTEYTYKNIAYIKDYEEDNMTVQWFHTASVTSGYTLSYEFSDFKKDMFGTCTVNFKVTVMKNT